VRLSLATLGQVRAGVRRPAYDVAALKPGVVHLGVGAFHRAHQAWFTEDAIEAAGGDWGIVGVSMRKPVVAEALSRQDGLYTVEILDEPARYRVIGALRRTLTLPLAPQAVTAAIADPATHVVTLTVTEKGYCLAGADLDFDHPDIAHDVTSAVRRSAVGVLVAGLTERRRAGGGPLTVISCDNLADNGARLGRAVIAFAERTDPALARWIEAEIAFPQTMVDSIAPAPDARSRARVEAALGLTDEASVQREPFSQWVLEDRFAGPRPAWERAGVEIVADVAPYRRLKLHGLNAMHSALAYAGLARGHTYVREAMADPAIAARLDALARDEIAPALPDLPIPDYWRKTRARFANPRVDFRLEQVAGDGGYKLAERIHPLMVANARAGLPFARMAAVVRAWLDHTAAEAGEPIEARLDDPRLFSDAFRADPRLRAAVLSSAPEPN
jgi:fructuronate reductase